MNILDDLQDDVAQARNLSKSQICLCVWKHNGKALKSYQREDFQSIDTFICWMRDDLKTNCSYELE